jgi:hypothetical protein
VGLIGEAHIPRDLGPAENLAMEVAVWWSGWFQCLKFWIWKTFNDQHLLHWRLIVIDSPSRTYNITFLGCTGAGCSGACLMYLLGFCPKDIWLFQKGLRSCNVTCTKVSLILISSKILQVILDYYTRHQQLSNDKDSSVLFPPYANFFILDLEIAKWHSTSRF